MVQSTKVSAFKKDDPLSTNCPPNKAMHEIPNVLRRIGPDVAPLPDAFADNLQTSCPIPIRDATAKQMVQRLKPSKEKLMFHFFKKASKKKRRPVT